MKDLTLALSGGFEDNILDSINEFMNFVEHEVEQAGLDTIPLTDFNRKKAKRLRYNHYRYYLNNGLVFDVEYDTDTERATETWDYEGVDGTYSINTHVPIIINYVVYRSEEHATNLVAILDTTYIFSFGVIENKKQLKSILHLFDRLEVPMCDTRI